MLFPSASGCTNDNQDENEKKKSTDWLQAKSFTSETAKKVVEFQKELQVLQGNQSLNDEDVSKVQTSTTLSEKGHINKSLVIDYSHEKETRGFSDAKSSSDSEDEKYTKNRRKGDKYHSSDDDYDERKKTDRKRELKDDTERRRKHKEKHKKRKKEHRRSRSPSSDDERHKKKKKKKQKYKTEEKREKETKTDGLKYGVSKNQFEIFTKNAVFLEELGTDIAPEDAFRVDRKPDKNNLAYGSLYKQHIALYKDVYNDVIGTRKLGEVIMKEKDKNKKYKASRYFDKESRKLVRQKPVEIVPGNNSQEKDSNMKTSQCISQDVVKLEKHVGDDNTTRRDARDQILDSSTALYIRGKSKSETVDNIEDNTETLAQSVTRTKVAEFNKKLQVTPDDIQLWLDFIKFQDSVFTEDESTGSSTVELDGRLRRVVLEKKISIVEKALQANPGNIDLMLHKIELNTDLVDATKINKELEQLLFVHSANTRLWKYYLNYNQSKLALFTVTRMTKLYDKCLTTLIAILEGAVHTHSVPDNLCGEILDILIQYCYFLKQAGHREKTIGTIQAIIEYNIFCPPDLRGSDKQDKMAAFEMYWNSEVPVVGCKNGTRWDKWFGKRETIQRHPESDNLEDLKEAIIEKKLPKWKTWLEIETLCEQHRLFPWLPGEGETVDDCEDLDAVVVFDDVSPVLFDIPPEFYLDLVIAVVALDQDVSRFQYCSKHVQFHPVIEYIGQVPDLQHSDKSQLTARSHSSFSSQCLTEMMAYFTGDDRTIVTLLYIEVRLKGIQNGRDLCQLSKSEKKEARKVLKEVLKQEQNRNNLYIWAVYIEIERQIGKHAETLSIVETAILMHSGCPVKWFINEENLPKKQKVEYSYGLVDVFVQYIEILLGIECGRSLKMLPRSPCVTMETKHKVQYVISCLFDGRKVDVKHCEHIPGATRLRIMSKFPRCIGAMMEDLKSSTGNSALLQREFLGSCWCYSLFSYCCNGLQSGLDVYAEILQSVHDVTSDVISFADLEERLLESKMRLIVYHMTVCPSPLHILRENLDDSLARYPENELFLALFVDIEKKARISGRMNRYFDRQSRVTKSPIPVIVAVYDLINTISREKEEKSDAGENVHDISGLVNRGRRWLENCINQSNSVNCPLIWRLYLRLEKLAGNESKMKGLFYRSVQQCPGNKNLYKDAVEVFRDDKLQEIVDLLMEKELRVHLPVEELDILLE